MLIAGLQKLSLLDYPGKLACTVFTGGCNLRCPYCHNSELIASPAPVMTDAEFFAFLSGRKGKLEGVCVTGGEPCLQKDLVDFLREIRRAGFAVKLDSNGCYPAVLQSVLNEGLIDYAAVDMKNSPAEYAATTGVASFDMQHFLHSVSLLLSSGIDFELRTTVVEPLHTAASMAAIVPCLLPLIETAGRKIPHYYLQPFTDRDTVPFAGFREPAAEILEKYAGILAPLADRVEIRG